MSERDNLPRWDGRRGRYEVWFLTLTSPDGVGWWIRYAVRAPIAGPPEPRLWFARFDRTDPGRTFGVNVPVPRDAFRLNRAGFEVRMGDALLGSGGAAGSLEGAGHRVRWDLRFESGDETLRLLPELLYRGALAPTKPWSPNPEARFSGTIDVDGETMDLQAVPGQQGHLYGTRHAERWAWMACSAFEEGFGFQVLSAQGRRGPFLTPFLTFAGVRAGGRWIRLRGMSLRRTWGLGWWQVALADHRYRLEGAVRARTEDMVRARYLDPDDSPRWCHNSEVASARLLLWERRAGGWQQVAELDSEGTTHAEWAGRTPAHQVPTEHVEVA